MANDKRFVVKNGLQTQNILFKDSSAGSNEITVRMLNTDTLSFSGNSGQLFSITDSLTGTIFSVNDISGVPSIEVDDDGTIRFAEAFGYVLIGSDSNRDSNMLQVTGGITIGGYGEVIDSAGNWKGVAPDATTLDGLNSTQFLRSDSDDSSSNSYTLGSLSLTGDLTAGGVLYGPSTFYIDPAPVDSDAGLVVIRGDLQVDGTTTTVNSTTVTINDKNLVLADSAANASEADGAGITINGASATINYASVGDKWTFNKPIDVTGNIIVSGTVDGRDIAADGSKLDGIEAGADVTDTANVTAAGALMDTEVTNLAAVKSFDPTDYATAAQGSLADSAVQPGDNISVLTNDAGYTTNTGTVTSVNGIAGTGISISGGPITASGSLTITNTAPDQTVVLTEGSNVSITGTYPNFTIAATDTNTTYTAGTGLDLTGTTFSVDSAVLVSSDIGVTVQGYSAVLAATTASYTTAEETKLAGIEAGATADQTASEILTALLTVDGTGSLLDADLLDGNEASAFYLASNPSGYTTNVGTVTSVAATVPTGFTISGSPITSSGTLGIAYDTGYQGYTTAEASKLAGIEAGADVTDTANVTAAGALMDTEIDSDIKTLSLPANTTISAFGATLVDDADAATARTTLGVDAAGTDNSTDVTLAGTPNYITISGQVITRNLIDLSTDVTGDLPITEGGTGASSAADARTNLGLVIGTDVQAYSSVLAATTASFTTADETKLDGIEAGADVTDTANVTAAGALMDTEVTNLAAVKAFDPADYATAAQGVLADSAVQPGDNISILTNDAGYTTNTGTVTSVNGIAGTGISISGGPITGSGSLTITNTAPDQTVVLTEGSNITITGTYPNFTIASTAGGGGLDSADVTNLVDSDYVRQRASKFISDTYVYTATSGQTTFTGSDDNTKTLSYVVGNIHVFLNGVSLISGVDYTATNGSSVVLTTGAASGDVLAVSSFSTSILQTTNADLLDSQDGTYYLNYNNFTNTPNVLDSADVINIVDSDYVLARAGSSGITTGKAIAMAIVFG